MAYEKQNFIKGQVLKADHLNKMEEQIVVNETSISQKSDLEHTHEEYADKAHTHTANSLKVPSLVEGDSLTVGMDLNNVTTIGNYRCTLSDVSNSLINCPCVGWLFTMQVGQLPNNPGYLWQEITLWSTGERWYRRKNGATADWTGWYINFPAATNKAQSLKKLYPSLSNKQKSTMKKLMDEWLKESVRDKFYYEYNHSRDKFASNACYDADHKIEGVSAPAFMLNCSTFAQQIIMGRSPSDFVDANGNSKGAEYTSTITIADGFDFGYYFQFRDRATMYGLVKDNYQTFDDTKAPDATNPNPYYGWKNPNSDKTNYEGSYSYNTFYDPNGSAKCKQIFNNFCYANDMAKELWEMGCEVPISAIEQGDILFFHDVDVTDDDGGFNKAAWKNITHVGLVYNVGDKPGDVAIIDCTTNTPPVITRGRTYGGKADIVAGGGLMRKVAMVARMPIAFGYESNVPTAITLAEKPANSVV